MAAHYLNSGLWSHIQDKGVFSSYSLKSIAEHLRIFVEVSKSHHNLYRDFSINLENISKLVYTAEFAYFCLRNKENFRLWGSIVSDASYFMEGIQRASQELMRSLDAKYLIGMETTEFRKLDAADIFFRGTQRETNIVELTKGTLSPYHQYIINPQDINTTMVYHLTHYAFYLSNWGGRKDVFNEIFYKNLNLFLTWSMAIRDADLVAECVVAVIYSGAKISVYDGIEFIISGQQENGAIIRSPSNASRCNEDYSENRHTTIVVLWALSEFARAESLPFSFNTQKIPEMSDLLRHTEHDQLNEKKLEKMIHLYGDIDPLNICPPEKAMCHDVAISIKGYFPFACDQHHIEQLQQYSYIMTRELGIIDIMHKHLLLAASGNYCEDCHSRLVSHLKLIEKMNSLSNFFGDSVALLRILGRYVNLPVFTVH